MTSIINVINEKHPVSDKDLFFGPLEERDEFIVINDNTSIEELLVLIGKFKSKSESRRNAWKGDIPKGFNHIIIGKNKNRMDIFILN